MIRIVYSILLIMVLPFFLIWLAFQMIVFKKYRRGIKERFACLNPLESESNHRNLWFHCASVGEVLAAEPLIRKLKHQIPDSRFFLTVNTDTGFQTAQDNFDFLSGVYQSPFDLPCIIKKFIRTIHPDLLIIMETELWPNMLHYCDRFHIPVVVANGRISDRSFPRYKRIKWFLAGFLKKIAILAMQSQLDVDRIIELGAESGSVKLAGNVKYDRQINMDADPILKAITTHGGWLRKSTLVAGSTHADDEIILLTVLKNLRNRGSSAKLILVPRHLERIPEILDQLRKSGLSYCQRSQFKTVDMVSEQLRHETFDVLVLDMMGQLTGAYGLGTLAFVGGTFHNIGGHNLLEPAAHAIPVIFGPHVYNFKDAAQLLLKSRGAIQVATANELETAILELLENGQRCMDTGMRALDVVNRNQGAVELHADLIIDLLKENKN